MVYEWDLQRSDKMALGLGDFNENVGKYTDGFEAVAWWKWLWNKKYGSFYLFFITKCCLNFVMKKK